MSQPQQESQSQQESQRLRKRKLDIIEDEDEHIMPSKKRRLEELRTESIGYPTESSNNKQIHELELINSENENNVSKEMNGTLERNFPENEIGRKVQMESEKTSVSGRFTKSDNPRDKNYKQKKYRNHRFRKKKKIMKRVKEINGFGNIFKKDCGINWKG